MVDYSAHGLEVASIVFAILAVASVCARFWSGTVNPGIGLW